MFRGQQDGREKTNLSAAPNRSVKHTEVSQQQFYKVVSPVLRSQRFLSETPGLRTE